MRRQNASADSEPISPSTGRQTIAKPSGEWRELKSVDGCEVEADDRLILETPGGGGWGPAQKEDDA